MITNSLSGPRRSPTALKNGPATVERVAVRRLAQLEAVAEDHEAVHVVERVQQRLLQIAPAQEVGALLAAEVQVRDDEGPHAH